MLGRLAGLIDPAPASLAFAKLLLLGNLDDFTLYEREGRSSPKWRNLKLVRSLATGKANWFLGWNGERLAENPDAADLATNHPDVLTWLLTTEWKT